MVGVLAKLLGDDGCVDLLIPYHYTLILPAIQTTFVFNRCALATYFLPVFCRQPCDGDG